MGDGKRVDVAQGGFNNMELPCPVFFNVNYINTVESYLDPLDPLCLPFFVSLSTACDCICCDQKLLCHLEMRD